MVAQINVESKNPKRNFERMLFSIEEASAKKAALIIFPELALPGYLNGDFWECTSFLNECEEYHEKIAKLSKSKNIDILFGSVGIDWKSKNEDGRVRKYNAAFFAHKGKFLQNKKTKFKFWPKTLLPQYREFDDTRHFFDLRRLAYEKNCRIEALYEPIFTTYNKQKIKIGISICEDVWDENYSISPVSLFSKKYKHDIFVNISASPFTFRKDQKRYAIFSSHAKKIKTPFIYANCIGTQNIGKTIFTFDGSSKVYTKQGKPILNGKFCEEENILFDLFPVSKDVKIDRLTPRSKRGVTKENRENFCIVAQKILETAIKLTCEKWNISRVVIGISGGIDSALSSVLFTRVLGSENVYLVNMPTKFNADLTKNAAKKIAQNLNCNYGIFSIEEFVNEKQKRTNSFIFKNKTSHTKIELSSFNFENLQARERGAGALATIASALNAVFSCNTNKSEMTVGYGTLYGDLAGFLCPIGDLWKHQVYELSHYYNDVVFQKEIIPNEIFTVTPSAELSAAQDVRKGLGDPLIYDYHDYLFSSWVEQWERKTADDCIAAYEKNTIDTLLGLEKGKTKKLFPTRELFVADIMRWWNLFQGIAAIKRVQTPPIIAISKRAFGFDYRESI